MMTSGFEPGHRVHHPRWNLDGTVVRILDADSLGVKWDGTSFTEDEVSVIDVEQIPGYADPAAPFAIANEWTPDAEGNAVRAVHRGIEHPDL